MNYNMILGLVNEKKLNKIKQYSNAAIIPGIGVGGYTGLNLSEMITNSPTVGIAALLTGASLIGFTTRKYVNEIGREYLKKKQKKELDDFINNF